jgi:hypothetical protein
LDFEISKIVLDFGIPSPDGNENPGIQKTIFSIVFLKRPKEALENTIEKKIFG